MKSKKNLIEQLKSLSHFNKNVIYQLGRAQGLTDSTIDTYISRYLKSKEIIQLKKGLYVSSGFLRKNQNDISYSFYLANVLRTPSYISSWTALQYYDLVTESVQTFISVTSKITKTYETKAGSFSYRSIQGESFFGFTFVRGNFDFYIASPSKALFDLLYFKTRQFRGVKFEFIKDLIVDLRIDFEEMESKEQEKFYKIVETYLAK